MHWKGVNFQLCAYLGEGVASHTEITGRWVRWVRDETHKHKSEMTQTWWIFVIHFVTFCYVVGSWNQAHADHAYGWCSWWQLCFQRGVPVLQVENPGSAPGIGLDHRNWGINPSAVMTQITTDAWSLELLGTVWNCLVLPCDSNSFWFWSAVNKTNQQDTVLTETYLAKFCRPDMLNGRKRSTVSWKQSLQVTSSSV